MATKTSTSTSELISTTANRLRRPSVLAAGFGLAIMVACGRQPNGTCDETSTCVPDDAGPDVVNVGDGAVDAPAGCDANAEPKDAPKCVDDSFGVFVDATGGADGNAGTKASPVKSISGALGKLGGKARVYVCEGTYTEHVKLTSAASIYGGFACGAWTYSGIQANVAPTDAGYALEIDKVSGAFEIADVSFTAIAGTEASTSSVAAFANASPSATLRRVALSAGKGFPGKSPSRADEGALMSSTPTTMSLNGNTGPNATTGGLAQFCTCVGGATSKGGGGGNVGGDGNTGETAQPTPTPTGANGAGQTFTACGVGGSGTRGSDAPDATPAAGATTLGTLTTSGWAPTGGSKGTFGGAGQGGGGGGGSGGGGGGGACGGCGGAGGDAGEGGGASIALMTLDSPLKLLTSRLVSSDAGAGGAGGMGGAGIGGGTRGVGTGAACNGGNGGNGGKGADGGGGAGGISIGVLSKGGKPSIDATITTGAKGAPGSGAVDGQRADSLELQ